MRAQESDRSVRHTESKVEGFAVHTLANAHLACSVAPELGARVVSLRDAITGREWLDGWSPESERRIWRPSDPNDYATGPGAGLDECLPTVLPCTVQGRALGDHGELWNTPTCVEVDLPRATLVCRWRLAALPLDFERAIRVAENRVHFEYRLENRADEPTPFQWAWHPLFTLEAGDLLEVSGHPDSCMVPGGAALPWPDALPGCDLARADLAGAASRCAKVFLGPLDAPTVALRTCGGSGLALSWDARWMPFAGVWITRGGWKGLHHWAVEPTNAPVDRLSDAIAEPRWSDRAWLRPREVRQWQVIASLVRSPAAVIDTRATVGQ